MTLSGTSIRVGDVCRVFGNREWGGKDVGDNSQFFHPATILAVSVTDDKWRDEIATVRFHHDDRISRGHFTKGMEVLDD